MITKHTVIYKLYPNVTSITEPTLDDLKAIDKDGNAVTIDLDTVNTEYAKFFRYKKYKNSVAKAAKTR